MSFDATAGLIALMSLLKDKGILTDEEITEVRRHGKVIPFLIERGLLTQEDYDLRSEMVHELVGMTANLLKKGPPYGSTVLKIIKSYEVHFPTLVKEVFQALKEGRELDG